jgi:hypothetical protein
VAALDRLRLWQPGLGPVQKGSFFDGLRARFRYGWVTDQTSVGDQHSTDLRIDVNLPINFF